MLVALAICSMHLARPMDGILYERTLPHGPAVRLADVAPLRIAGLLFLADERAIES